MSDAMSDDGTNVYCLHLHIHRILLVLPHVAIHCNGKYTHVTPHPIVPFFYRGPGLPFCYATVMQLAQSAHRLYIGTTDYSRVSSSFPSLL